LNSNCDWANFRPVCILRKWPLSSNVHTYMHACIPSSTGLLQKRVLRKLKNATGYFQHSCQLFSIKTIENDRINTNSWYIYVICKTQNLRGDYFFWFWGPKSELSTDLTPSRGIELAFHFVCLCLLNWRQYVEMKDSYICRYVDQGCQIFLSTSIPERWKYTKWRQNYQIAIHRIYQMAVKYSKWNYNTQEFYILPKVLQNLPKLVIFIWKFTIWQPRNVDTVFL
jgi:hypothetical protein